MGLGVRLRDEPYPPPPENGEADTHPSVYDIGLTFGPTSAHRLAEMRIERGAMLGGSPILTGPRFSAKLTYYGADGTVQDETDSFTYELTPSAAIPPPVQDTDPLARGDGKAVRVMTYNVLFGSIFKDPEPFARVISAINPDAIVFQELVEENSGEQLLAWLNEHVPGESGSPWRVHGCLG